MVKANLKLDNNTVQPRLAFQLLIQLPSPLECWDWMIGVPSLHTKGCSGLHFIPRSHLLFLLPWLLSHSDTSTLSSTESLQAVLMLVPALFAEK